MEPTCTFIILGRVRYSTNVSVELSLTSHFHERPTSRPLTRLKGSSQV